MPLLQGAPPSAHPVTSETNVTEFGANPGGTFPGGTGGGGGVGVGEGCVVAVGRITVGDGDRLGCGEAIPGFGEHAARNRQVAPTHPANTRPARPVRAITARNGTIVDGVTPSAGQRNGGVESSSVSAVPPPRTAPLRNQDRAGCVVPS